MSDQAIQLMHGDARLLLPLLPTGSVDMIVTDPPYRVISGGRKPEEVAQWGVLGKNDGKIFEHNDIRPSEYLPEFYRVLKDDADLYLMVNVLNLREFLNSADAAGFRLHNVLTWNKGTATPNRWYMHDLEMTLYLYKGRAKAINLPGSKQSFYCPNPKNKRHPCEKPVHLMNQYILNSSQPGGVVLDPFMGSGPASESCLLNGRQFIGMEIDPAYFKATEKRLGGVTRGLFTV